MLGGVVLLGAAAVRAEPIPAVAANTTTARAATAGRPSQRIFFIDGLLGRLVSFAFQRFPRSPNADEREFGAPLRLPNDLRRFAACPGASGPPSATAPSSP